MKIPTRVSGSKGFLFKGVTGLYWCYSKDNRRWIVGFWSAGDEHFHRRSYFRCSEMS